MQESIVTGRVIVIAPTVLHVHAVQKTLAHRMSQREPISMEELRQNPDAFTDPDQVIFILTKDPKANRILHSVLSQYDAFMAKDVLLADHKSCVSVMDNTSLVWGQQDPKRSTREVLKDYPENLARCQVAKDLDSAFDAVFDRRKVRDFRAVG